MKTLHAPAAVVYEVKQSKFLAHLVPYAAFDATLERLKTEHPKARHFVTAYRCFNAFGQIVEGSSDDGEPKGTSGKPSLAVLAGYDLVDVAVVTVRYFGGTKLGTGGLVRAYTHAVSEAVSAASLAAYVKKERTAFMCAYAAFSQVEYLVEKYGAEWVGKRFESDGVYCEVTASAEVLDAFLADAGRLIG